MRKTTTPRFCAKNVTHPPTHTENQKKRASALNVLLCSPLNLDSLDPIVSECVINAV